MWSAADDYARHVRRYTRRDLEAKLRSAGLELRRITSFVTVLLPAMVASRLLERRTSGPFDPSVEHERAARWRRPLLGLMSAERALIRVGVSLPIGGSLLAVAERVR